MRGFTPVGLGGDAWSRAEARGLGVARADATAQGGTGTLHGLGMSDAYAYGSDARALATSSGSAGQASAEAVIGVDGVHGLRTRATSQVPASPSRNARASAAARYGELTDPFASGAFATGALRPDESVLLDALAGNDDVQSIVLDRGLETVQLLGMSGVSLSQNRAGELLSFSSEFDLIVAVASTSVLGDAYLAFLDPSFGAAGIHSLQLLVKAEGETLFDLIFDDALLAAAFLDDNFLELGSLMAADGFLDLHIAFALTTDAPNQLFRSDFVLGGHTPEPSTGAMLVLGLLWLGRQRRAHGSRSRA